MKSYLTGLLGSAVLVTSVSTLHAEEQSPVIVTATRTAQTADASLASVTVITEADIQRSQASSIQDLLQGYAGLDFRNNGGAGKTTSLIMRGTNSTHVLVMIDGIRVGSATSGTASFQDIPVSQIERIEIVRGPRSSLYGSEAIGGVIQIFTKKGHRSKATNLSAGMGSYGTESYSLGVEGSNDKHSYSIKAAKFKTEGFNAKQGTEPDDDGYKNDSVNLNYKLRFGQTSDLAVNILRAEGANKYDGTSVNQAEFVQQAAGLNLKVSPVNSWNMSLQASQSRDESDNYLNGIFKTRYNTRIQQTSWQNDFVLNTSNIFTLGADYRVDEVDSSVAYKEKSRDNSGAFLQHQWSGATNDIIIGLRYDDNEAYGTHTTQNIGWGYNLSETYRFTAAYGTAFSAPSFNQLYYPGYGVATLKPEESESYELGLRSKYSWGQWDIHAYRTNIENMIGGYPPANINQAEINGLELRLSGTLMGMQQQVDLSYTDPRDTATDKILARRSRKSLRYSLDSNTGNLAYGATIIGQGEQYDDAANTKKVSGYGLLNLRASYALGKEWSLRAKIDNALDKKYESIQDYNQAGMTVFASINYQGL